MTLAAVEARLFQLWSKTVQHAPTAAAVIEAGSGRVWSRAELAAAAVAMRKRWPSAQEMRGRRVLLSAPNARRLWGLPAWATWC